MGKRSADILESLDGRHGIWSIPQWCTQAGMSHVTLGHLDPQPHHVKVGRRLKRITESPKEYYERRRKMEAERREQRAAECAS
jgi:hypothetical protein